MTREQLRSLLLAGADKLRNSIAWRFMSNQERNLSICGREFWSKDEAVTNAALDDFATILSTMQSQLSPERKGTTMDIQKLTSCGIPQDVVEQAKTLGMDAEKLVQLCITHSVEAARDFLAWCAGKLPSKS